ncbi:TetR/AcrR family transcriptional regulator [Azospirillum sp. TSO35-2]|uniref:TetR/AcrR family transcriptional regulator n=1 Tax=Azospirillum sp. TSO35-2 TaxID=716796 RepID=UPI000D65D95A|nr:TetR/AcrR family transcriptional regulator [Azospirillum sp. TSO35-2]
MSAIGFDQRIMPAMVERSRGEDQMKRSVTAAAAQADRKPPMGLRERKKLEKDHLIRQAARRLFVEKGFDETTLREVAREADVGFGTVFAYATDKTGLLAMVYVDELRSMPPLFDRVAPDLPLADQIVAAFGMLYIFWSRHPQLSKLVLQQLEFYGDNPHVELIVERRAQTKGELAMWLAAQQSAGRIAADVDVVTAADTLFAIYTSCIREWIVTAPGDPQKGLDQLRRLIALPVTAIATRQEPDATLLHRGGGS